MGSYLDKPVTDKVSETGTFGNIHYGASSMQGWRKNQEDAHSAIEFPAGTNLFAVFDGKLLRLSLVLMSGKTGTELYVPCTCRHSRAVIGRSRGRPSLQVLLPEGSGVAAG